MFVKNLEIGREGEVKVITYLQSQGLQVQDYTDYSKFKAKQQKGYDIEMLNKDTGEWDRIDIKSNLKNKFLYLEDTQKSSLGWFWTSTADLIFHYDLKENEVYGYELKRMRNYVYKNELKPSYGREKNLIGIKTDETKIIKKL